MSNPQKPVETPASELGWSAIFPSDLRPYPFLSPAKAPGELGWLGSYRVVRAIGQGGMGVVFEAVDTVLHRTVAIKVLKPEAAADPENRERFLREARAAAGLHSDHIITVYQVGVANDVAFLASQLLRGESLQ